MTVSAALSGLKKFPIILFCLAFILTACSGGGGSSSSTSPSATIQFPPLESMTEAAQITVRGTATQGVANLSVNGIAASSTDGATWLASVPLVPGKNTLNVEIPVGTGSVTAAQAQIERGVLWGSIIGTAIDSANNTPMPPIRSSVPSPLRSTVPTTGRWWSRAYLRPWWRSILSMVNG